MNTIIPFLLANFTLTFLVLGLLAAGIALTFGTKPITKPRVVEALFSYSLLFAIGFAYFSKNPCGLPPVGR